MGQIWGEKWVFFRFLFGSSFPPRFSACWGGLGALEGDAAVVSPRCPHVVPGLPALRVPLVILPLSCAVAKQRPGLQPRCASCIMHGAHSSGSTAHPERCVLHTAVLTLQPGPHPAPPPLPPLHKGCFCTWRGCMRNRRAFARGNCFCTRELHLPSGGCACGDIWGHGHLACCSTSCCCPPVVPSAHPSPTQQCVAQSCHLIHAVPFAFYRVKFKGEQGRGTAPKATRVPAETW